MANQSLFDHDPIRLTYRLNHSHPPPSQTPKLSFFKAVSKVLLKSENILLLQSAWQASNPELTNPHFCFFLATKCLQLKYKELQTTCLLLKQIQDKICNNFNTLKIRLQSNYSPELLTKYVQQASLLRDIDLGKVNKWRKQVSNGPHLAIPLPNSSLQQCKLSKNKTQ